MDCSKNEWKSEFKIKCNTKYWKKYDTKSFKSGFQKLVFCVSKNVFFFMENFFMIKFTQLEKYFKNEKKNMILNQKNDL
jgi:hypothetical protein